MIYSFILIMVDSWWLSHYGDVIMSVIASQITSPTIVYSSVYSVADQRKHQSSASLAFVRGIHRRPVNSPHKGPVTRKMFPFDDVIMPVHTKLSWPSNAVWRHASGSALAQIVVCCPNYLNQCWLIIRELLHSHQGNLTGNYQNIYLWYDFKYN